MDPRSVPKGRGALLKALALKKEERELRPGGEHASGETSKEEPQKPRGRAALLLAVREQKAARAVLGSELMTRLGTQIVFQEKETPLASPSLTPSMERMSIAHEKTTTLDKAKPASSSQQPELPVSEKLPSFYKGETGTRVPVNANYIRMEIVPGKGVFEYHMDFKPSVDAKSVRCKLLRSCIEQMGNVRDYDGGSCLYLPIRLVQDVTEFDLKHPIDGSPICVTVTYKKQKKLADCVHLFNVLFKRVMKELKFKLMGRNHFDPHNPHMIPQHRLEILPGYAVAVDEYEGGLMVCLDVQHRVLRTQTALQLIDDLYQRPDKARFHENVTKALIGSIVLTKYNNNTYRVDDVLWELHPTDGFPTNTGTVTFSDYYKRQYGLEISNLGQPMLLNIQKRKKSLQAEEEDMKICLVPEFCWLTGMTDEMRSDFKVMRDVAEFTRITPQQRKHALMIYMKSVNNSPEARQILANWGIKMAEAVIDLEARILPPEVIMFGRGASVGTDGGADWTRDNSKQACVEAIDITDWVIVHTTRDSQLARDLSSQFVQFSKTMGCRITPARLYAVKSDRTNEYVSASQEVIKPNVQVIVYIFGSQREDLYSAVKKICCVSMPIASQVVLARNLNHPKKSRTVMIKLALQINCKLGGALWALKFPCKTWMIIGIDVYHSPKSKQSVLGFVASSNPTFTCWFSQAEFQDRELSNVLKMMFIKAMEHYRNVNASFPTQVVIFRDSVGEGQFEYCNRHEVGQFEEALRDMNLKDTRITVIIVQKRINTRLIMPNQRTGNPPPGTVVDHTITKRYYQDFFLVPQSVTQGTVMPTHYVVIHDPANHKVDNIQRLAFKLCHMYYNWSGTIRVPAPCQYAHKLAGLVGQYIGKQPHPSLEDKLYYL